MDYTQLHSVLAANIHAQTIAERDYKKAQAEADKWEKYYQLALKAGRRDLVREAQFRKNICATTACNLKAILDDQTERVANLRANLTGYIKASTNSYTTSSSFKSLEEKLQQIEARFQAVDKLPGNNLTSHLRKVESELESMRTQLLNQQASISKLLQQNSNILEDIKSLLEEASFDMVPELGSIDLETQLVSLEFDNDVNDELTNIKFFVSYTTTSQNHEQLTAADTAADTANQVTIDAELEDLRSQLDQL